MDPGAASDVVGVQFHVSGFDSETPGVPGIHRQVDDHRLDLTGVHLHRAQALGRPGVEPNVLADEPLEHLFRMRHDAVQVHHIGF